ncbi:uncharacterized protein UDID_17562 [Ustilago sp. UG-2017a]|nr:uncharacterized protein UDID_17562 [Ustilago sp. UG-2017a]
MAPPNHSERIKSLEDQVRSLLAALDARNTQEPFNDSASAQQGFQSKEPEAFTGERGHLEPFLAQVDVFLWLNPGRFIYSFRSLVVSSASPLDLALVVIANRRAGS